LARVKNPFAGALVVAGAALVVAGFSFRGAFAPEEQAVRALQTQGFSLVRIEERSFFFVAFRGCDGSDAAMFRAHALNPANREVEVYVCTGWPFKGATVRVR
jgi:hypothetical protein